MRYQRVLVKLSGGALRGEEGEVFSSKVLEYVVEEITSLQKMGIQVALVVGGGNLFRGSLSRRWKLERAEGDQVGMLGTVVNGLILRALLSGHLQSRVRVLTSIAIEGVAESYIRQKALHYLGKGDLLIFVGGIGQPFVTTDYAAVQRAVEMQCQALLVAKEGVEGVYSADPKKNPRAHLYQTLSHRHLIEKQIDVMDQAAILLAEQFSLPLHICNFSDSSALEKICSGQKVGTHIYAGATMMEK